jgi:hypothetical protein
LEAKTIHRSSDFTKEIMEHEFGMRVDATSGEHFA